MLIYPCLYRFAGETRLLKSEEDLDIMLGELCNKNALSTAARFNGGKMWKGEVSQSKSNKKNRMGEESAIPEKLSLAFALAHMKRMMKEDNK